VVAASLYPYRYGSWLSWRTCGCILQMCQPVPCGVHPCGVHQLSTSDPPALRQPSKYLTCGTHAQVNTTASPDDWQVRLNGHPLAGASALGSTYVLTTAIGAPGEAGTGTCWEF
jgi:hypothetical protein